MTGINSAYPSDRNMWFHRLMSNVNYPFRISVILFKNGLILSKVNNVNRIWFLGFIFVIK